MAGKSSLLFVYAMGRKSAEISYVFKFQLSSFNGTSSVNFADTAGIKVR